MALHTSISHTVSALHEFSGAYTCGKCHAQSEDPVKCNYPVLLCQACTHSLTFVDPPQEFTPPTGLLPHEASEAQAKREALLKGQAERTDTKAFVIEKRADVAQIITQGLESIGMVDELKKKVADLERQLHQTQGQLTQSTLETESLRKSRGSGDDISEMRKLVEELRVLGIPSHHRETHVQSAIPDPHSPLEQEINSLKEQLASAQQTISNMERLNKEKDEVLDLKNSLIAEFKSQLEQLRTDSHTQLIEVSAMYAELVPVLTHMRMVSKECFEVFVGKVGLIDSLKAKEALKTAEVCVRLAELAGPSANMKALSNLLLSSVVNNPEKIKRLEPFVTELYAKLSASPDRGKDTARLIISAIDSETFEESLRSLIEQSRSLSPSAFCGFALSVFQSNTSDSLPQQLYSIATQKHIDELESFLWVCGQMREAFIGRHAEKAKEFEKAWEGYLLSASKKEAESVCQLLKFLFLGKDAEDEEIDMLIRLLSAINEQTKGVIDLILVGLSKLSTEESRSSFGFGVLKWLLEGGWEGTDFALGKEMLENLVYSEVNMLARNAALLGRLVDSGLEFEKSCEISQLLILKAPTEQVPLLLRDFQVLLKLRPSLPSHGEEWLKLFLTSFRADEFTLVQLATRLFVIMIEENSEIKDAEDFSKDVLEIFGPKAEYSEKNVVKAEKPILILKEVIKAVKSRLPNSDLASFWKNIMTRMHVDEEFEDIKRFLKECLLTLHDENVRHLLVLRLFNAFQKNESTDWLQIAMPLLRTLNVNLKNTIDIIFDKLERKDTSASEQERGFKVFFSIVPRVLIESAAQEVETLCVIIKRACKVCSAEETVYFLEMLNTTKLNYSFYIASQLLSLKETFMERGIELPVLNKIRTAELKQVIERAKIQEDDIRASLNEALELATQFLAIVEPNVVIDFLRHVLSHAFSNPYPQQLLRKLQNPCILFNFKQFLTKQKNAMPVQTLFSFVAGGIGYVEPGRMKFFSFSTHQWNEWIMLSTTIKVDYRSKYVFLEDDQLFCCGGYPMDQAVNTTYLIRPAGQVRELATMNTARFRHGLIYLADRRTVYVFGGWSTGSSLKTGEKFDLKQLLTDADKGAWARLPDMTDTRTQFNPCFFNGLVYLCGNNSTTMDVFDPEHETMTKCADGLENNPSVLFEDKLKIGEEFKDVLVVISNNYIKKFKLEGARLTLVSSDGHENHDVFQSNFPIVFDGKVYISNQGNCILIDKNTGQKKQVI